MEDFIVLFVFENELLFCGDCKKEIKDAEAYLIHLQVNRMTTARVRCQLCYCKESHEPH